MRKRTLAFAAATIIVVSTVHLAQTPSTSTAPVYLTPPKEIVEVFDAPPLPQIIVSPNRQLIGFQYRKGNPTIAELARPMLRPGSDRLLTTWGVTGPYRHLRTIARRGWAFC